MAGAFALLVLSIAYAASIPVPPNVSIDPAGNVKAEVSTRGPAQTGESRWVVDLPSTEGDTFLLTSRLRYHEIAMMRGGTARIDHEFVWTVDGKPWHRHQHESRFHFGEDDEGGLDVSRQEVRRPFGPSDTPKGFAYQSREPALLEVTWGWALTKETFTADTDIRIEFQALEVSMDGPREVHRSRLGAYSLVVLAAGLSVAAIVSWRRAA